jgi:hypothetical protein
MTYQLCGHCLHGVSCHEPHNGHFMYCGVCFALCENSEHTTIHKPTSTEKVMEISAKKQ